MRETRFTGLVGCEVPIQSAPMGGISGPDLVTACTAAGAMAMVSFPLMPVPVAVDALERILRVAKGPVGVNVLLPFLDRDLVAEAARRAVLVDLYHGPVDGELVELIHGGGSLAGWQVCSVDDARAAQACGCDVLVVRGIEGGGRMHGRQPLRPLLDDVVAAVDVPVLAAGGVGTAAQVAELLDAGAAGVRVGTRLLAAKESNAHDVYKRAVIDAGAGDTAITEDYHVMWPDAVRSARVISSCVEAARQVPEGQPVGTVPTPAGPLEVPAFAVPPPTREVEGRIEAMPLYAGTAVEHVHGEESAGDIIRSLTPV